MDWWIRRRTKKGNRSNNPWFLIWLGRDPSSLFFLSLLCSGKKSRGRGARAFFSTAGRLEAYRGEEMRCSDCCQSKPAIQGQSVSEVSGRSEEEGIKESGLPAGGGYLGLTRPGGGRYLRRGWACRRRARYRAKYQAVGVEQQREGQAVVVVRRVPIGGSCSGRYAGR